MARRVIYKHWLALTSDPQVVTVKGPGMQVLDFQMQGERPTIWMLENYRSNDDPTDVRFLILGTGEVVEDGWTYVGTVQQDGFVWHLFQEVN